MEKEAEVLKTRVAESVERVLGADLQRLEELALICDHVRPAEITATRENLTASLAAIGNAKLRLDAIRLLLPA